MTHQEVMDIVVLSAQELEEKIVQLLHKRITNLMITVDADGFKLETHYYGKESSYAPHHKLEVWK